jgi:hypothetical protein
MVATSLGLPYEIYDLVQEVTAPRAIFFAVNLALVLYLVITKRLFGVRGGKHAYEARLRSESIMATAIELAALEAATAKEPAPADADAHRRSPTAQSPAQDPSRPATEPTAAAEPSSPQPTNPAARTTRA